jgi:hypothetical protein
MPKRGSTAIFAPLFFLWSASLLAYGLPRAFLVSTYGLRFFSPGLGALLAILLAATWVLVDEPRLVPGGRKRLLTAWAAAACLVVGEALIYPVGDIKDLLAPTAFALMGSGALLFIARPGARQAGLKILGALLVLGLVGVGGWSWLHPDTAGMDLVAGPPGGHWAPVAAWGLLLGGFIVLGALAHQVQEPQPEQPPLGGRREAWLLIAVLGLAALIRFPQMGTVPEGIWYDEVNLSRVTESEVLNSGKAPLYVGEQVENPGAYLWVGAAVYKVFGTGVLPYRYLAAFFGFLALFPFWGLARRWFGARWALAATALFAVMRWTLIPQRIAFMSGFALFWMLAAFWAFWFPLQASLRAKKNLNLSWRWVLAGALAGCNLYTYTPGRLVPVVLAIFMLLELLKSAAQGGDWRGWVQRSAWMALGFALIAGPMLAYIFSHWATYALRSAQVSLFSDAAANHLSIFRELWVTATRHLLMFNLRGDYNARHNLHFYPQVDGLTASALALGLPYALGRFFRDARSRFLALWLVLMLSAGIFSLAVEAPQGHRTILAAPVLALAVIWALKDLVSPLGEAFEGGWPRAAKAAGLALLLSVAAFNAYEVFGLWSTDSETWRSFSPFASAAAKRAQATDPGVEVYLSQLSQEYQFHGFEMGMFVQYFLRPRQTQALGLNTVIAKNDPSSAVLLIWSESDKDFSAAFAWEFPGIALEKPDNPHPVSGEPDSLYLAAEIPVSRIPHEKGLRRPFLIAREGTP